MAAAREGMVSAKSWNIAVAMRVGAHHHCPHHMSDSPNLTPLPPSAATVTEGEILSHALETIDAAHWREVAQTVSKLALPERDLDRVDHLLAKNRADTITPYERSELEKFLRVGNFLALVRARASREMGPTGA